MGDEAAASSLADLEPAPESVRTSVVGVGHVRAFGRRWVEVAQEMDFGPSRVVGSDALAVSAVLEVGDDR